MRVVAALGGNALLRRGEVMTAENQRANVRRAAQALAEIAKRHDLVISHGNGPQVGLLALQNAAYPDVDPYPLDILGAETEGMIGYMIEQELENCLPSDRTVVTLLTQVEVDRHDPAFGQPTKPVGPVYSREQAERLAAAHGWTVAPDGDAYRRVVPSPHPKRIPDLHVIDLLLRERIVVICAGGGGIPTVIDDNGKTVGVEAVVDKDRASALLATDLGADALIMLTDVDAVYEDWGGPGALAIRSASPPDLRRMQFASGSMGPKVEAACAFADATGGTAAIGRLEDAAAILNEAAGTIVKRSAPGTVRPGPDTS